MNSVLNLIDRGTPGTHIKDSLYALFRLGSINRVPAFFKRKLSTFKLGNFLKIKNFLTIYDKIKYFNFSNEFSNIWYQVDHLQFDSSNKSSVNIRIAIVANATFLKL